MTLLPGSVLRLFRVRPWLPLASIALLGTAVGLHTAIFAAIDVVLLTPLPFTDLDRLVVVHERKGDSDRDNLSTFGNYRDYQRGALPFASLGAYENADPALFAGEAPHALDVIRVTGSLFHVLGSGQVRGRVFSPEEEQAGANVAILTDAGWTRYFGRSEQVIGARVDLDGIGHTVIGIASPAVGRVLQADILLPFPPPRNGRGERVIHLLGRLANGVTIAAARDAMSRRVADLETIARENDGFRAASLIPLQDAIVAGIRAPMLALELLSLFIVIVVAANLVGLQFARLEWRARELAIRAALGASRRRLIGDAMAESATIAITACALAVVVAHWMLAIGKATLIAPGVLQPLQIDGRAIAAAAIVAGLVACGSGLCSVLMLLTRDLAPLLHAASTTTGPGRLTQRAQTIVVITQTALALIFVVVAFTLIGEVARLLRIDPGFRSSGLWTIDVKTVGGAHVQQGVQPRQYAEMLDAVRALPGVDAAGAISSFPLLGLPGSLAIRVRDVAVSGGERTQFRLVMPGYFATMGIAIRDGRDFAMSDDRSHGVSALVAIVNRAFADRYWPGANPIGREVAVLTSPWIRVIGVADNVRSIEATQLPVPELYMSSLQATSSGEMTIVLRTHPGAPPLSASAVRAAIQRVAPTVAVSRMGALDARLAEQRRPQQFGAAFLSLLALLAMGLAAAGTYGLVSYAVSSRRREIAVRRVLGAAEPQIARRIAAQAALAIAIGSACGVGIILMLARVYQSVLLSGHVVDPRIVTGAAAVLAGTSLLASYLPVRRAIGRPLREVLQSD